MSSDMEYVQLGASDTKISRIGFGCWAIGGHGYGAVNDEESIRTIQEAVSCGINLFDTADVYGFGHSEEVLSKGLGVKRHEAVIATKFGVCWDENGRIYRDSSAKRVVEALEGSLRRLKVESIPLYQIHYYDGISNIEETMEALGRCREAGKIRMIGCTNLSKSLVETMNRIERMSSLQMQYNLAERQNEDQLQHHYRVDRMSTLVYGVLVRGLLSGKYDEKTSFGQNDTRAKDGNFTGKRLTNNLRASEALKSAAKVYGKSQAQISIRWTLDVPFVSSVLVGMKTRKQVADNVGAIGWNLSQGDWQNLSHCAVDEEEKPIGS